MPSSDLEEVQRRLGHQFRHPTFLIEALTHTSYRNESGKMEEADNERLEFLGDAVLNLAVSEYLVQTFPEATEGELSKIRSRLVSEDALASAARRLGLGGALRLGRGETITEGGKKPSILADAMEAVFAAVYLDSGLEPAVRCIRSALSDELTLCGRSSSAHGDFKTELQELCQRDFNMLPQYRTVRQSGPDHEKTFEVEILIRGERYGVGVGRTKKEAEQRAAQRALEALEQQ
jgi:ribonuclease-3